MILSSRTEVFRRGGHGEPPLRVTPHFDGIHAIALDVDSQRLRIGTRYTSAFSTTAKGYIGAAWEHEFDGKAKSSVTASNVTVATDAPKLKGSSGIAEVGLNITPSSNKAFTVDIGLQGYVGKRQGATGSVQAKYEF
jgi:outer membrane autotransporter protein